MTPKSRMWVDMRGGSGISTSENVNDKAASLGVE
jgi:hypothetical protein